MAAVADKAVIFDLSGTLVPGITHREYGDVLTAMARQVGASEHAFVRAWFASAAPCRRVQQQ